MSLQLLQCGIFVSSVRSRPLKRVDVGDVVQWNRLRRDVARRILHGDVSHAVNVVEELDMEQSKYHRGYLCV